MIQHPLLLVRHLLSRLRIALPLAKIAPQTLLEILLLPGKLLGLVREIAYFRAILLFAHRLQRLARLFQSLGGTLGFGFRLRSALLTLLSGLPG